MRQAESREARSRRRKVWTRRERPRSRIKDLGRPELRIAVRAANDQDSTICKRCCRVVASWRREKAREREAVVARIENLHRTRHTAGVRPTRNQHAAVRKQRSSVAG